MAASLTKGQIAKGHKITIIATQGSICDFTELVKTIPPLKDLGISVYDPRSFLYGVIHAKSALDYINSSDFDIVHSHVEQCFLPFVDSTRIPIVSTIHGTNFSDDVKFLYGQFRGKFIAIALSEAAKKANPVIDYYATVYNGVDMSLPAGKGGEYMYHFGRINQQKGVKEAIEVANIVKRNLIIRGYRETRLEEYPGEVKDMASKSPFVEYQEEFIPSARAHEFFGEGKFFLFPLQWEEPFGLVMAESMAAGTPVVAFARGSVPEIVVDGVTGFIVNASETDVRGDFMVKKTGIDGLCEAVEKIYKMDNQEYQKMRENSRKHAEEHFSIEKMVDNYEKLYQEVINK